MNARETPPPPVATVQWRCRFGFHTWSHWSLPTDASLMIKASVYHSFDDKQAQVQMRLCSGCGRAAYRRVTEQR